MTLELLNPTSGRPLAERQRSPRPPSLRGGSTSPSSDISKPREDVFLYRLEELPADLRHEITVKYDAEVEALAAEGLAVVQCARRSFMLAAFPPTEHLRSRAT
ncbi:hypothetical protein [Candidatus Nephthysia bennettiae]|uniref:Uncharacterized protein n=1 Tax=Candidatus Nephthysia bennettiae TaxID=3127016 RepID=A0A934N4D6_9BACT|nr:hypothetical protein [Candidatus Dormibacteraeota bacterium]